MHGGAARVLKRSTVAYLALALISRAGACDWTSTAIVATDSFDFFIPDERRGVMIINSALVDGERVYCASCADTRMYTLQTRTLAITCSTWWSL